MLAVVAGGVLVRIFILFHDCCHGSFFASRRANAILGYVTGILTFTPFEHWRRSHNRHHATAGNLDRRGIGDVWTMTTEEYLAAPLVGGSPTGSTEIPLFCSVRDRYCCSYFQRFSEKTRERRAERASHQHGALVRRWIGDVGDRFSDISIDPVARHSDCRQPRALVVLCSASI